MTTQIISGDARLKNPTHSSILSRGDFFPESRQALETVGRQPSLARPEGYVIKMVG